MATIEEFSISQSDILSSRDRQVLDVYGQLYGISNSTDELRNQLKNDFQESRCFVLDTDEGVAGVANYQSYPEEGTSHLFGIAVERARRGAGYGAILMNFLLEQTATDGNERLSLAAYDGAVDFYTRLGFDITDDADPSAPIMNKVV